MGIWKGGANGLQELLATGAEPGRGWVAWLQERETMTNCLIELVSHSYIVKSRLFGITCGQGKAEERLEGARPLTEQSR